MEENKMADTTNNTETMEQQAAEQDQGAKTFHGILQWLDTTAYAPLCRYYNHPGAIRQILLCQAEREKSLDYL